MALTKLLDDLSNVSKLDDQPNDVGGMNATELKAVFDRAGNDIKAFINNILIPEIESAIGSGTIEQISGGKLVDLSVTAAKIAMLAITSEKLANGAVTTQKIANGAVNTDKIALSSVVLGSQTSGILPITQGGTGASGIQGLKSALGTIAIEQGGTGSTTADGARDALGINLENLGITYGTEADRPQNPQPGQIFLLKVE